MRQVLIAFAFATLAGGCANLLSSVGDKQALGPPDLFSLILVDTDPQHRPQQAGDAGRTKELKLQGNGNFGFVAAAPKSNELAVEVAEPAVRDCRFAKDGIPDAPWENPRFTAQRRVCQTLNIFASTVKKSLSNINSADDAKNMFKAGANASDALCLTWFSQLDGARRASAQARAVTGGLGTLTNAVQVLTGVEPNPIGITSAAFSQLGLGFESTERNYLLPANLALIANSMKLYRMRTFTDFLKGSAGQPTEISDYFMAEHYLRMYHETCSSNSIEYFIADSIQRGSTQTPTIAEQAAKLSFDMESVALADQIGAMLAVSTGDITVDDVVAISGYVVTLVGKNDNDLVAGGRDKYLSEKLKKNVTPMGGVVANKDLGGMIKQLDQSHRDALKAAIQGSRVGAVIIPRGAALAKAYEKPPAQ